MEKKVYIAPNATVVGEVELGHNANIWYGAVLRGDSGAITVGEGTNIQDNCVLHEQTRVGSRCTVGHGAILHGCTVGDGCLVSAGALVTGKTVAPAGSLLLGSPAKIAKTLTPEQMAHQLTEAEDYIALARKMLG